MIHKNVNIYLLNLLIKFAELKMEKKKQIYNECNINFCIYFIFISKINFPKIFYEYINIFYINL